MGLTDTALKNAKPKEKKYKLSDEKGLYVLVLPTGGKYFQFDYAFAKKRKTISFGVYPEVTLREAREEHAIARKQIDQGIDPSDARKAKKHSLYINSSNSFYEIASQWFEKNKSKWSPKYAKEKWHKLEMDIFPYMGARPINNITTQELLSIINKIEARGAIETAHRTKNIVREVYVMAVASGIADRNIAHDLDGALSAKPPVTHRATITDPIKVGGLLRAIDGFAGTFVVKCALMLSPYVFLRPGEVAQAEWAEIDLQNKIWKIPAGKMKMNRVHLVPLADQVMQILEDLHPLSGTSKYVFPSLRTKSRHMNESTVNAAIRNMGYTSEEICAHGFRGMASTLLYENGFDGDIIEMQLAHVETNEVKAAYNHAKYLPKRTEMMQWWANYLDELKNAK